MWCTTTAVSRHINCLAVKVKEPQPANLQAQTKLASQGSEICPVDNVHVARHETGKSKDAAHVLPEKDA